jgi:hypothetical protein
MIQDKPIVTSAQIDRDPAAHARFVRETMDLAWRVHEERHARMMARNDAVLAQWQREDDARRRAEVAPAEPATILSFPEPRRKDGKFARKQVA